jgi:hypothetical protein
LRIERDRLRRAAILLLCISAGGPSLFAATIAGKVTNGTTNKPSIGDEVILIKLGAGMEEVGQAKTDGQGKFSFSADESSSPHLVRAIHQGVTYHEPAPPGTSSVELKVYDVAAKMDGVRAVADLMYLQAARGQLGVTRIFAVDNTSSPPRTQMNDANFEFFAPPGAEIDDAEAQTAGGQKLRISPVPQAEKGRYAFVFPLRPGQTEFQVTYHLSYSGKATIDPQLVYPLQHFVAMMPRSIGFTPAQPGVYQDKQPPDMPDAIAEVASNPRPGQKLSFEISGEGTLRDQNENASATSDGNTSASAENRPGGGLGRPTDAPDPMDKYRWPLLGGFGLVLTAGAFYTVNRSKGSGSALASASAGAASTALLDGLKDELFQLEVEHKQGQISDSDYGKAKSALDETLARAIRRKR